jgi:hypothetical protein
MRLYHRKIVIELVTQKINCVGLFSYTLMGDDLTCILQPLEQLLSWNRPRVQFRPEKVHLDPRSVNLGLATKEIET